MQGFAKIKMAGLPNFFHLKKFLFAKK